jgi:hypothetical protein
MIFASYADFRTKVQILIDGDDISQSDLSVTTLDLIISAGEERLYRDIRSSTQDTAYSLVTAGNLVALPTDCIELKGAPYVTGYMVATYTPWEAIQNLIQLETAFSNYYGNDNHAVRYSFQSDNIIFFPVQNDGVTVTGQYYKRFPDLSTGLNALFTRHPDVFLYAALAESAPFLGEVARLKIWEGKYQELVESANETERRRYTRGGKLQTRIA